MFRRTVHSHRLSHKYSQITWRCRRALPARAARPCRRVLLWPLCGGCDRACRSRADDRARVAASDGHDQGTGHAL